MGHFADTGQVVDLLAMRPTLAHDRGMQRPFDRIPLVRLALVDREARLIAMRSADGAATASSLPGKVAAVRTLSRVTGGAVRPAEIVVLRGRVAGA